MNDIDITGGRAEKCTVCKGQGTALSCKWKMQGIFIFLRKKAGLRGGVICQPTNPATSSFPSANQSIHLIHEFRLSHTLKVLAAVLPDDHLIAYMQ
jgi:hypothetical protein